MQTKKTQKFKGNTYFVMKNTQKRNKSVKNKERHSTKKKKKTIINTNKLIKYSLSPLL